MNGLDDYLTNEPNTREPELTDNELIERFYVSQGGKPNMAEDLWFYESDWNMLMRVIDKFMSIPPETFNYNGRAMTQLRQRKNEIKAISIYSNIMEVYIPLLGSIKWYNEQPK